MIRQAADAVPVTSPSPLMTIEEVAEMLGIHPVTVTTKHTTGKMPAPLRLGHRTIRFRRSDIDFWIANGCKSAAVTKALKESAGK